jgi:hypothetical protein
MLLKSRSFNYQAMRLIIYDLITPLSQIYSLINESYQWRKGFFCYGEGNPVPRCLRHSSLKTRKRKTILHYFTFIFYDTAYTSVPNHLILILLRQILSEYCCHFLDGGC